MTAGSRRRSHRWTIPKRAGLWAALALSLAALPAFAQTPVETQNQKEDVQHLQEQVRQLEQLTQELKARLAALEKSQPGTPQAMNTSVTQPAAPQNAPPPQAASETNSQQTPPNEVAVSTPPEKSAPAQATREKEEPEPRMDIYGYAMLDMGYDFGQNDPNWFDVMRPTKLPSFTNEFGRDGRLYTGVRQSRHRSPGSRHLDYRGTSRRCRRAASSR